MYAWIWRILPGPVAVRLAALNSVTSVNGFN